MEEQFNKGFFEFIAAADAEKVHSQTIGWIFSNDCDVFDDNEKNVILKELVFGDSKQEIDLTPSKVNVEINDIDILITCRDRLIVIENKIKSSQHSNQLYKYEYITSPDLLTALNLYKKWKSIEFPDENFESEYLKSNIKERKKLIINWEQKQKVKIKDFIHQEEELKYRNNRCEYVYLTLVKEKPESSNWKNITYSDLYKVLDKYFKNKNNPTVENHSIVKSYLKTIGNLSRVTELFIESPSNYKYVFTEGKTIKGGYIESESEKGSAKSYIKNLGLETLLQRWFYSNLLERIKIKEEDEGLHYYKKCITGETNGTALLDFYFDEITLDTIIYTPILQFQSNAIKLALAGGSDKEKPNDSDKKNLIALRKERFVEKLKNSKTFKQLKNIEIKLSTPKNSDGFISININQKYEDNGFWQFDEEPLDFVFKKIKLAQEIFKEVI